MINVSGTIRLRSMVEEDSDFVVDLLNKKEIQINFPRSSKITKQSHINFIEKLKQSHEYYWIIEKDKCPVGTISIYNINYDHNRAEWGRFAIHPAYCRQGIGTSVLNAIIDYSFTTLKLHRLFCYSMSENKIALKLYSKLGFNIEGVLKEHIYIDGKYVDYIILGLVKK